MRKEIIYRSVGIACIVLMVQACKVPPLGNRPTKQTVPASYDSSQDTVNAARMKWNEFFTDPNLLALIDTALTNNQELNMVLQEINISSFEVRARKGEYLPFLNLMGGAGVEKVGQYTRPGAVEENLDIDKGKPFPDPLPDYVAAANVSWEVDIWKKLRNAKKSAVYRYLGTIQGKNFMVTQLVAEIAASYYELMALDNQLDILKANIKIQTNALNIVKMEKQAAKVTELAVRKFEAEVFKNRSRQFFIQQKIIETENWINFLVGRFPQPIPRDSQNFGSLTPKAVQYGIPSQLLDNRPDIQKAQLQLEAAKLDVKVAKANFYPSFRITAGVGLQAFNPSYLVKAPESMLYSLAGDLVAPLINRNAIKATYFSANSKQIQALYNYQQKVLNGYIEVANQMANISNLQQSYNLKQQQVQALNRSITISTNLFRSARADYMEVLMTQRDALDARMELVETKMLQMNAMVNMYRSLGGGWR